MEISCTEKNKGPSCVVQKKHVRDAIEATLASELQPGDVILLASFGSRATDLNAQALYDERLVPMVRRANATLVVVGDNMHLPLAEAAVMGCLPTRWNPRALHACVPKPTKQQQAAADAPFRKWAASHAPHVRFFPLWPLFCSEEHCGAYVPGRRDTFAYFDSHHLVGPAVLYLWPFLCEALDGWGLL